MRESYFVNDGRDVRICDIIVNQFILHLSDKKITLHIVYLCRFLSANALSNSSRRLTRFYYNFIKIDAKMQDIIIIILSVQYSVILND